MLAWVLLALGLWFGTAYGADLAEAYSPIPLYSLKKGPLPASAEEKAEEDAALAERMKALEAAQAKQAAKVVILKWSGTDVGYENATVQRNIRTRIARPDAKFYPDIDLYQAGRRMPDRTIAPGDQLGSVPPEATETVMAAVRDIETVPWNQMTEADWGITANNLQAIAEDIWFVDRTELREPLFMLYIQTGRAAENMNNPVAPFYQTVGGQLVNYYWYLAGVLAYETPDLLSKVTDEGVYGSIAYYKEMLDRKEITFMTLSFESEGVFDMKKFASEYQLFINGVEVLITNPQSLHQVPPGRVDVYLKRSDAHSISDRIELAKLEEKIYFVRDVARKRMGVDFIDQLMKHPNECTPRVDGDILTYLAIWATLHKDAEIYIAVPVAGNANKILLWRWNRDQKTLTKVLDETGGYPIRFAIMGGAGMNFNGAGVSSGEVECEDPEDPTTCTPVPPEPSLNLGGMPFWARFSAHWARLMVTFGVEGTLSLATLPEEQGGGRANWEDEYQVKGLNVVDNSGIPQLKSVPWNRLIYGGVGVVFMKNAAFGFGPRGWLRCGWYNVPHTLDLTVHGGLTSQPVEADGRIRFLVDIDGYAGALIPIEQTNRDTAIPSFGINIGAGVTF